MSILARYNKSSYQRKTSNHKKQQFHPSYCQTFSCKEKKWTPLILVLVGRPFFPMAFFSLFLESPTMKKTFCPLYLRKRFYGFGQAPLFFFPSEVSFLVIFFILLLRTTIFFLLRVHEKKASEYETVRSPLFLRASKS